MSITVMQTSTNTYEELNNVHLNLWRLLALVPFENRQLSFIGTRVLFIFFLVASIIYHTMHVGYGIRMIANHRFEIDYVCEMIMVQSLTQRYMVLFLKQGDLIKLLQMCKELWNDLKFDESEILKDFGRKINYYRQFFFWSSFTVVAFFMMTSQFVRLPPITANGTDRRLLPFRWYVDVQEEPAYMIVTAIQGVVDTSMVLILTGIETVGPFLILMACGYLRAVNNRLMIMSTKSESMKSSDCQIIKTESQTENSSLQEFLDCVKFHQTIMRFCEEIERFMQPFFMTTMICTVYNLSLIGLQLIKRDEYFYKYASLLSLNFLQLYICQWSPEQLLNESGAIANNAYFAAMMQKKHQKKINNVMLITMLRAQKPVQLTAGGFINLSVETFGNMITKSFSFFTVVRNFSDEN